MAKAAKTEVRALRLTPAEATLIHLVAEASGTSVSETLRQLVVPAARARLATATQGAA